jgi:hypothetical protein
LHVLDDDCAARGIEAKLTAGIGGGAGRRSVGGAGQHRRDPGDLDVDPTSPTTAAIKTKEGLPLPGRANQEALCALWASPARAASHSEIFPRGGTP